MKRKVAKLFPIPGCLGCSKFCKYRGNAMGELAAKEAVIDTAKPHTCNNVRWWKWPFLMKEMQRAVKA
ncbi:hypothetical protein EV210_101224 [Anaerospora hongkongensis]|uniref:Uncharacterized protein n=1 Tax=Anaerospora hongkongensis TaxID=244830 RepID=A0A4R1Q4L3_9FIRM|nr:hypothetical protein [Anaerospora hongkongensis]TCL40024.1 hypothetical protein EV210_101224 [Anaerospora hongkongensis]